MSYPGRPVAGSFPAFLNPFDPLFQANAITFITGEVAGIATPNPAFGGGAGGAVVIEGPWTLGNGVQSPNPRNAIFGWSYINIVPPGFNGTTPMNPKPGIVGPRLVYWTTDQGGVPFLT